MKKRILFSSEFSLHSSGFSKYVREVLKRLHKTGKYELAEMASFIGFTQRGSEKRLEVPWTVYPNLPLNSEEENVYRQHIINEFGAYKFDEACLDFKPDIVVCYRDHWMEMHVFGSPLRKYFNLAAMACIDSSPVRDEWLAMYMEADALFGYCDWTIEELRRQGKSKVALYYSTPPGADFNVFRPISNKAEIKQSIGLNPDSLVIGMVARNQKRKLLPDLMHSFRMFLDKCMAEGRSDIAEKAYLYTHTSYPDVGYDLPNLIKEFGLSRKMLFTYICHNCKHALISHFRDVRTQCLKCGQLAALMTNPNTGVSEETLSQIYGVMDLYIQYATNEGAGMPQIEAAACGVPVMSVDYSASSDIVRKLNGVPLPPKQLFREVETQAYKAVPDNDILVEELYKFCIKTPEEKQKLSDLAIQGAHQHFDYDMTVERWMQYFDQAPSMWAKWREAPKLHTPNMNIPGNLNTSQLVKWLIVNVLGDPDKLNSSIYTRLVRELNLGMKMSTMGTNFHVTEDALFGIRAQIQDVNIKSIIDELVAECNKRNYWEQRRTGIIQQEPEFIKLTHLDQQNKVRI